MPKFVVPEKDVLSGCLHYLVLRRIFHWRQNSSGTPLHGAQEGKFRKASRRGVPDILAVHKGHAYAIECKSSIGRLSDDQIDFRNQFELAGGTYILARGIEDLMKYF